MSRALEPGIKQALCDVNHAAVFEEIAAILSLPTVLEIELLGYSHYANDAPSFIRDGNAIAIPKLRLVQAFMHARNVFVAYARRDHGDSEKPIMEATAVMLLFDPEHLTAANTRKRLVSKDDATSIAREKLFVDSLLTSRLHRHSKSPNLWSHRRWLMEHMRKRGLDADLTEDFSNVILISAERHARNYYAWRHARHLIESVEPGSANWSCILAQTVKWCRCHHDDVSGWMFLALLLERWPAGADSVVADVLELTESLRWRNESVWYFLRNVVAGPQLVRFDSTLRMVRGEADADNRAIERASSWIQKHPTRQNPYGVEDGGTNRQSRIQKQTRAVDGAAQML
ncbi:hypothetical protein L249_0355 [Ophiocordyceps polyrhachis-furcata BCC 54312]|uniref:Protein prenyltransferase n=1 Tax=Ophiocordyceps polyrhachis-furcata BCC 54312 TaxID=1330021 RepID=A0A367LDM2_9HYPO|nr:hypothetical protein L249_0355 [Ophiocordyceps polyrhachis-furcata BCC 54312]